MPEDKELQFPETRIPTAMILAQRIIDLFEEAEATDRERRLALNIARSIVVDEAINSSEISGLP
jgi:hypothetical protein